MKHKMLDAQAAMAFAVAQTTYIEPGVYKTQYPAIVYPELVPVDTSAPEWIKSVTYYSNDFAGIAKYLNGAARDIPLAELERSKAETTVQLAGIGYGWDLEELSQAQFLGMNLSADKASAAREIAERKINTVALSGDTTKGFEGLLNNSGVDHTAAADGVSTTSDWPTKTADEILFDVNDALSDVNVDSQTIETADTLLLPNSRLQLIAGKRLSSNNDTTVLKFLKENNVFTQTTGKQLTIRGLRELETAGAGGLDSTKRMAVYDRRPEVVKMHIPMPFKFLPVWQDGPMHWLVPGIFRLGGVDVRRPGAMRYRDGI